MIFWYWPGDLHNFCVDKNVDAADMNVCATTIMVKPCHRRSRSWLRRS